MQQSWSRKYKSLEATDWSEKEMANSKLLIGSIPQVGRTCLIHWQSDMYIIVHLRTCISNDWNIISYSLSYIIVQNILLYFCITYWVRHHLENTTVGGGF